MTEAYNYMQSSYSESNTDVEALEYKDLEFRNDHIRMTSGEVTKPTILSPEVYGIWEIKRNN